MLPKKKTSGRPKKKPPASGKKSTQTKTTAMVEEREVSVGIVVQGEFISSIGDDATPVHESFTTAANTQQNPGGDHDGSDLVDSDDDSFKFGSDVDQNPDVGENPDVVHALMTLAPHDKGHIIDGDKKPAARTHDEQSIIDVSDDDSFWTEPFGNSNTATSPDRASHPNECTPSDPDLHSDVENEPTTNINLPKFKTFEEERDFICKYYT